MMPVAKGQLVQICQVVLEPGQRAPQAPDDTQQVPLQMFAKGVLTTDARLGSARKH
jgi:hypothetical protein